MYLALYRKWRPKTFEDVIGQPHITFTLKNEVSNHHTAHAYLFTGPRGTGKTTCSKILSMAVNCQNPINGNPCMECASCKGIQSGSILDVVEIDAASNNGVENIRQLRDEASYTPTSCKFRVYIIDEAHMLSTGAFNALLKIMEEPPSHVLFILATTEAHKVPATILSRCQRFDFRRINSADIEAQLLYIASQESEFTLEPDAAKMLARLADGGMRDALSLLDQCIAFAPDVTVSAVVSAVGIVGRDYLYELTDCIIANDSSGAIMIIDKLYAMSKDLQGLLSELIHHFRNIMLTKMLKHPEELVGVLPNEQEKLVEGSNKFSTEKLLYIINVLQDSLDKMSRSIDRRLCLELCLIKLCTPSLVTSESALLARIEALESAARNGASIALNQPQMVTQQVLQQVGVSQQVGASRNTAQIKREIPPQSGINPQVFAPTAPPQMVAPTAPQAAQGSYDDQFAPLAEWSEIMESLKKTDQPLWGVLHGSVAYTQQNFIYIESPLDFVAGMLRQDSNAAKLVNAVFNRTGIRYKIRIKSRSSNTMAANESAAPKANLLDSVLNNAKNIGIEVRETAPEEDDPPF